MIENVTQISEANITNASSTDPLNVSHGNHDILTIISGLVCAIILFVGIIGNTLVLIVFGNRWSHLKACEIFLMNLAVVDLIGTLVTPTIQLYETMGGDFKPIGDVGCKLIHFSIITSVTVQSLTLIAITFDRFVIVKWPLHERKSTASLRIVVMFTWILGTGPGILYLVGGTIKLNPNGDVQVCRMFLTLDEIRVHTIITFSIQVVVPLFLMIILYSIITYELWKATKSLKVELLERLNQLRHKRNKKAIKLLAAIVIMYFVCIAPVNTFFLLHIYKAFHLPGEDMVLLFTILQMLQMINSCINPIIYSKLHYSFRRKTFKLFFACCLEKVRIYRRKCFHKSSISRGKAVYAKEEIISFPLERICINNGGKDEISLKPFFSLTRSKEYRKPSAPYDEYTMKVVKTKANRQHPSYV